MKNILSYDKDTAILGKEIKEWIKYQIDNNTSHCKEAKHMEKYESIKDDAYYYVQRGRYQASGRNFMCLKKKES